MLHKYGPKILLGLFNDYRTKLLVGESLGALGKYFINCIHYQMHASEVEDGSCTADCIDLLCERKSSKCDLKFYLHHFPLLVPPQIMFWRQNSTTKNKRPPLQKCFDQVGKPERLAYTVFPPLYQFTKMYQKATRMVERSFHW